MRRRLPKEYGNWHVIYKRYRYWLEKGYIDRLFKELCAQSISQAEILAFLLDSMTVPVHPNAWLSTFASQKPPFGCPPFLAVHGALGRVPTTHHASLRPMFPCSLLRKPTLRVAAYRRCYFFAPSS